MKGGGCLFALLVLLTVFCGQVRTQNSSESCLGDKFLCLQSRECIHNYYVCDGDYDCQNDEFRDISDESHDTCAHRPCTSEQFKCMDNVEYGIYPACISSSFVCDGFVDCANGTDEKPPHCYSKCDDDSIGYQCSSDNQCIHTEWKCDHVKDCLKGEDEKDCVYKECTEAEFQCRYKACIESSRHCDGVWDCKDGSDEGPECTSVAATCPPHQYQCNNGKCIARNLLCDHLNDCVDNSDEIYCNLTGIDHCADNDHGCSVCLSVDFSYRCTCNPGYKLQDDGKTCADINECYEQPGICSQVCQNNPGSYSCSCSDGYRERDQGRTCTRTDYINPYLIFGNRYYVRKMNLDGTGFEHLSNVHEYTHVLDYDYKDNKVFLIDAGSRRMMSMSLDSGDDIKATALPSTYLDKAEGMAVDWVGKKLYWSNNKQQGLYVSETNGTGVHVLLREGSSLPRAIALHPQSGYLYWSDWSLTPFIARIGMDGSRMKKIITSGIFWPNGLTIDYATNQMWWIDAHLDRIEFSNLDGTNRHPVMYSVPHGFSITLFEEFLYWTEWNLKTIEKANKYSGKGQTKLNDLIHQPFDVHVVHPTRQPNVVNPCGSNNGQCSHLCLLAPGDDTGPTFKCACPETFVLKPDMKTCWRNCSSAQMECGQSDHKCVDMFARCNNVNDCSGGEDEENCPAFRCPPTQHQCNDESKCISKYSLCNGREDCTDGSDEPEECSERTCLPHEFRCASGQCLPKSWACDSEYDCVDRSDEGPKNTECTGGAQETCDEDQFRCDNQKCIPKLWHCDWDDDCGDQSDEPRAECFANTTCEAGWIMCRYSYRCIPGTAICNGKDDCRDNSDEADDQCGNCAHGDFKCDNGRCIPERWLCDIDNDCNDNSDEKPEICATSRRNCSEVEFRCKNGQCISDDSRCDRTDDCTDGSDEEDCETYTCAKKQFSCTNGQCISDHLHCDGVRDCIDSSDEIDCPTRYPGGRYCREDKFTCSNTLCVPLTARCNSVQDCGDGSDETIDACRQTPCDPGTHFRCSNQRCILRWKACDGEDDCGDGSDESNRTMCSVHPPTHCAENRFHCKITGRCIMGIHVCNNQNNCGPNDDSDELGCIKINGTACGINKGGCEQLCTNLPVAVGSNIPSGYICSCNGSYVPDEDAPRTCIDKDECKRLVDNNCTQECKNTNGAYFCKCNEGFSRSYKNDLPGICEPNESKGSILLSNGNELRQHDQHDGEIFTFVRGQRRMNAIAVDHKQGLVYWTDSSVRTIKRARIPTNSSVLPYVQDLNIRGMDTPRGIAVDWVSGNIYWSDKAQNNIYVCSGDGNFKATVVRGELYDTSATSIAVNPLLRKLYFINDVGVPKIMQGYMNGEDVQTLTSYDLFDPMGLAVDYHMSNRIFWTDLSLGVVMSVNANGQDRVSLIRDMNRPYYLDVFAGKVVWTSPTSRKLMTQDIFGRLANVTVLYNQFSLFDVSIYSKVKAPETADYCGRLQCNALCLLSDNGAKCACPDGVNFVQGSTQQCDLNNYDYLRREVPPMCSCQNGGICVFNPVAVPECKCSQGFTGAKCETKGTGVTSSTPFPTTRPARTTKRLSSFSSSLSPRTTGSSPHPMTTESVTETTELTSPTTPEDLKINTAENRSSSNSLTLPIVIPLVLVAIALIIVIVVIMYMYRKGTLGSRKPLHGQFREGAPGDGRVAVHMNNGDQFQSPQIIMPFDDQTQFANPMYDTLQTATDATAVAHLDTNANAEPLPEKATIEIDV